MIIRREVWIALISAITLSCSAQNSGSAGEDPTEDNGTELNDGVQDQDDDQTQDDEQDNAPIEPVDDHDDGEPDDQDPGDGDGDDDEPVEDDKPVEVPLETRIDNARLELHQSRSATDHIISSSARDYGNAFYVGDGVDVMTGKRVPSCFDPEQMQIKPIELNQVVSDFSIVSSKQELTTQLEKGMGLEFSGIWQFLNFGASFKRKIVKEATIGQNSIFGISSFTYLKEAQELYTGWPRIYGPFQESLERSPYLYRRHCGDKYVHRASVGATMHLTFEAVVTNTSQHNRREAETGFSIGWQGILGISIGNSMTTAQKAATSNYTLKMSCYTQGASVDVCGMYDLDTTFDLEKDKDALIKRINAARERMVADAKAGEHLVVVNEVHLDYQTPEAFCTLDTEDPCPKAEEVFYHYKPRVNNIKEALKRTDMVAEVCSRVSMWPNRCKYMDNQFKLTVEDCIDLSETCHIKKDENFDILMSIHQPGTFNIWEDPGSKGDLGHVNLGAMIHNRRIAPLQLVGIKHDLGWKHLDGEASSIDFNLSPYWAVEFYDRADHSDPGRSFTVRGQGTIKSIYEQYGRDYDNDISAFRLWPVPDM